MDLPTVGISYQWNPTPSRPLRLVYFTQQCFWDPAMLQHVYFICFHCQIAQQYSTARTGRILLSVCQLLDIGVKS